MTHQQLLDTLAPEDQLFQNLYAIHEYIKRALPPGAKLRLALYQPQGDELVPLFSWDGENRDCVSKNPVEMRISSAEGTQSAVVACYHLPGTHKFIAVSDCAKDPNFQHFRVGQSEYLKSLIAFKHRLDNSMEHLLLWC